MIYFADPSNSFVVEYGQDSDQAAFLAKANGRSLYKTAQNVATVDPTKLVAVPTDAVLLNPALSLAAYANTRRKAISEGAGPGLLGRLIPVTIASGTYSFPIDDTTRSALGDAAFQTTLPNGQSYSISAWLLPTGQFISLDAQAIMTVAQAVSAAFQSLFAAQKQVFADIASGAVTTTAQVDAELAASAPSGSTGG